MIFYGVTFSRKFSELVGMLNGTYLKRNSQTSTFYVRFNFNFRFVLVCLSNKLLIADTNNDLINDVDQSRLKKKEENNCQSLAGCLLSINQYSFI